MLDSIKFLLSKIMCNGTLGDTTLTSALVIMHNAQCQSKPHIYPVYIPVALSNLFNID